jgi:hypothetical protein
MQGRVVQDRAQLSLLIGLSKYIQLFFCAIVLAGKAEQFEEKSAALSVGRVVPNLGIQRLHCFLQFAGLEKLFGRHWMVFDQFVS